MRAALLSSRRPLLLGACGLLSTALFGTLLSACGSPTNEKPAPITVFAAASLTDVMPELASAWKADGGGEVRFTFGSTSQLVRQVTEGAPADALVSADEAWMDKLDAAGKAGKGSRAILARNELVFIVPAGATATPATAAALPGDLKRIALADVEVPAGKYAKAALEKAGVWAAVEPRVVRGKDVRVALTWVATADADGGIVYRTDAKAEAKVKVAFAFPAGSHPPIVYPGSVVAGSARAADAARFLTFCRSAKARTILEKFGFIPPTP
jgi:molybdate transport system substrate-binding protein